VELNISGPYIVDAAKCTRYINPLSKVIWFARRSCRV